MAVKKKKRHLKIVTKLSDNFHNLKNYCFGKNLMESQRKNSEERG